MISSNDNGRLQEAYQKDMYPLIERMALISHQVKMPMFLTFQDTHESFCTTCLNSSESNLNRIKLLFLANSSWDIDSLIANIIQEAKENGHNSKYLKAMGVPNKAKEIVKIPVRE